MKLIFIAGPWGSGTTALTGALSQLGVPTLGPYFESSDPKTKNTYELLSFRDLILNYVDEPNLQHKFTYRSYFTPALEAFKLQLEKEVAANSPHSSTQRIALKLPIASLCLPEICKTFATKVILMHRPIDEIEASQRRRAWPSLYGSKGAQALYSTLFKDIVQHKLSFIGQSYHDLVTNTDQSLNKIIDYCELNDLRHNLGNANAFIRKD